MRLVLTRAERELAKRLVRQTVKDGADATIEFLPEFQPDCHAALIAYLAGEACVAKELIQPPLVKWTRHQPEALTEPQRREAHRRYQAGERRPEVVAGEREYQRLKARAYRAKKLEESAA